MLLTLRIQNLREISWNGRIYILRLWTKIEQSNSDSPGFNLLGNQCYYNYTELYNYIRGNTGMESHYRRYLTKARHDGPQWVSEAKPFARLPYYFPLESLSLLVRKGVREVDHKISFLAEWESEWTRVSHTFTSLNLIEEKLAHNWAPKPPLVKCTLISTKPHRDLQPDVHSSHGNLEEAFCALQDLVT